LIEDWTAARFSLVAPFKSAFDIDRKLPLLVGTRDALEPKPDRAVVDDEPARLPPPTDDRLELEFELEERLELLLLLPPPLLLAKASPANPTTDALAIRAAVPATKRVKSGVPSLGSGCACSSTAAGVRVDVDVGVFAIALVAVMRGFLHLWEVRVGRWRGYRQLAADRCSMRGHL
jgi:hypothetical protein